VDLRAIVNLARSIKIDLARMERDIVSLFSSMLDEAGIDHDTEQYVAPRCRVDVLTSDGVVIEFKKGKPNTRKVSEQIEKYAQSDKVRAVVLVSERGLRCHLKEANGKPVEYVALSVNWGVAVS
jgi:hypothetical protein